MSNDYTGKMKARMRGDLVDAIKGRRAEEIALLRSLLAAIDNAEAPAVGSLPQPISGGSSEIERLVLTAAELQAVLLEEIRARERAAAELASLGHLERADALLGQAASAKRYVAPIASE